MELADTRPAGLAGHNEPGTPDDAGADAAAPRADAAAPEAATQSSLPRQSPTDHGSPADSPAPGEAASDHDIEPADEGAPDPDPQHPRRGVRRLALTALAVVVVLGLVAAAAVLAVKARDLAARRDSEQTAMQAARQEAVNLTTIDYRTADRDLGRIINAATGALRTQFAAQRSAFPGVLRQDKSVSTGTVLSSALVSLHGRQAQVMVAVDASVSNTASAGAGSNGVLKHYRMVMKLDRQGNRWLVSDVAFAGLPQ